MQLEVAMPVITTEGADAVVTAWFVDDAGACAEGDLIAEVQAEKVAAEVHAPGSGYLVNRVAIGDPVTQGSPIGRIVDATEAKLPAVATAAPSQEVTRPAVVASPAAKRVAKELGVDLPGVAGTGPEGRVTEEDVAAASRHAAARGGSLRAVIARNMRRSHAETAPVTLFATTNLGEQLPPKLTATVIRTVAATLMDHPQLNGRRDGDSFIPASVVDISVAVQTDDGLVAPVVRDVANRTVEEVANAIRDLAERAVARTLSPTDYEGGTFTVSNLGPYGIEGFTPIINLPQVAILGVGAARPKPVVTAEGHLAVGHEMVLSLTFDHAFVDGAPAAAFLQQLVLALQG